jgi:acetyl esterase
MRPRVHPGWVAGLGLAVCSALWGSGTAQEPAGDGPQRAREREMQREPRQKNRRRRGPAPDLADEKYGEHEAQVFDLWLAKSERPTPLLVSIHGGGFRGGTKDKVDGRLRSMCLAEGISFASVEYRTTRIGPYPMQHHDCARAVQHIRHHAAQWNIDPKRFAATGSSAGAGISLWLGFHDDLADPDAQDPIARESTRIRCALPTSAQCTYDPREIKKIVPGNAYNCWALRPLFGLPSGFNWNHDPIPPEIEARIRDCGPLSLLTKDDCPVYILNSASDCKPGNIHHGNFGRHLEKEMEKLGMECVRRMSTDYPVNGLTRSQEMFAFLKKHFGMAADEPPAAEKAPPAERSGENSQGVPGT